MDMFKSGASNTPETLVAVGGGAKHPINTSFRLVDLFTFTLGGIL